LCQLTQLENIAVALQEWDDADDGTMEGSLGYSNILESAPAAYIQLQDRLLAKRQQTCKADD
jgi:hypothetical protein